MQIRLVKEFTVRTLACRLAMGLGFLAYLSAPVIAQSMEDQICFNDAATPRDRISGCSKLLLQKGGDPVERARIYSNRGVAQGQVGQTKLAIADFDQALELKANDPAILNNRCYFLAVEGKLKKALADCDKAVRLQRPTALILDSKAYVHLRSGNLDLALQDYSAALELNPQSPTALWGRGIAMLRKGRNQEAERDFAGARRLSPGIDREMASIGLGRSRALKIAA